MHIASFFIPLFPLAARLRSEPDLMSEAVVIVEGNGSTAHIVAATRRARKEGIRPGLSLPQARAILPKLIARGRDAACEKAASETLFEVAETFSPRVEDGGEGVVYLDISGLERHFRSDESGTKTESTSSTAIPAHLKTLARAAILAMERNGLPGRVGIAASKLAARVAAELPNSPRIVAPGEEAAFLAPLPLARLTPELGAAAALARWGIGSIGELARLPEGEVASRLGETGRELHWAARGIDSRPLMPRHPEAVFCEGMDLEWPLVAIEPFLFSANAALDRLALRLEAQGFACKRLELTLQIEPEGYDARAIEMPAPTRDVKTMLTLIRLDLEAHPPAGPVAGFVFVAHPDRPRRAQLSLFGPPALGPDKLATTIARLVAMLGADRVGTPQMVDRHQPESFGIAGYAPPPPPNLQRTARACRGLLAVRVLRPALGLEVITDGDLPPLASSDTVAESPDLTHLKLRSIKAAISSDPPDEKSPVSHRGQLTIDSPVKVASGPWGLEEGWWEDSPLGRDYWDVELVKGGLYRIYRERGSGEWFVDGVYD